MYQGIIIFHVLVGLTVIGLILMQQGRGADAGAAFGSGGGASGTVFGAQGSASFLSRTTAILAAIFFATSLGLAILGGMQEGVTDLMDGPEVIEQEFPVMPLGTEDLDPMQVPSISEPQAEDLPTVINDTVNREAAPTQVEDAVPTAAAEEQK
jgi:preprotein translocase subunit SecG